MSDFNLVIASGKGGVGKSMLSATLAYYFSRKHQIIAIDADVDTPNLSLWLGGVKHWDKVEKISVSEQAFALKMNCSSCKDCLDICQFGALSLKNNQLQINPFLCEGCGACQEFCPKGTIEMKKVMAGQIKIKNDISGFPLVSAQLYPGQTGSGKIVDRLKQIGQKFNRQLTIIDSPAGTSCPVIASLNGADFALLITEPTLSGLSDLKRVLTLVKFFKIPWALVINKWDINPSQTKSITAWAKHHLLGKISYDQNIFKAIAKLTPIYKTDLPVNQEIKTIYSKLIKKLPADFQ